MLLAPADAGGGLVLEIGGDATAGEANIGRLGGKPEANPIAPAFTATLGVLEAVYVGRTADEAVSFLRAVKDALEDPARLLLEL